MSNLTGTEKSVILLMTIGEDRAAEVFKHLSQREVQHLSTAMAGVRQISNKQLSRHHPDHPANQPQRQMPDHDADGDLFP